MELFSDRGLETAALKLHSYTNHQRACLLGPFYLPLSVRSTPLSIPSALYVVSQFDRNGFIIALINRDKHWQHDGCCEHTLSLPLAQFVIIVFLSSFPSASSLFSSVFVSSLPQPVRLQYWCVHLERAEVRRLGRLRGYERRGGLQ